MLGEGNSIFENIPVTEEVLWTVLIEIEGLLNAKPIGYTFSDTAEC